MDAQGKVRIITVHGTGDGEDTANEDTWWKPGSQFCRAMTARLGGRVETTPFLWSGENDEIARRRASDRLLREITRTKDPLLLIGHSHGGSVIATALKLAAWKGHTLPHLLGWMTVGTPFIGLRRSVMPWRRFDILGQAVGLLGVLGVAVALLYLMDGSGFGLGKLGVPMSLVGGGFSFLVLWITQARMRALHSKRAATRFCKHFQTRWRGVTSRHDEVVLALGEISALRIKLFSGEWVAALLRLILAGLFVALIGLTWLDPPAIERVPVIGPLIDHHQDILRWYLGLFVAAAEPLTLQPWLEEPLGRPLATALAVMLVPTGMTAVYILLLISLLALANAVMRPSIGRLLSRNLNRIVDRLAVDRAFGNSTVGEISLKAAGVPAPHLRTTPLPEELEEGLVSFAIENAQSMLRELYTELPKQVAKRDGVHDFVSLLAGHLSWRELVHTSYFYEPGSNAFIVETLAGGLEAHLHDNVTVEQNAD